MAGASLTRDGPASDPGSYLALPDKGLRRQSFTALETAAAALEALQSTIASAETAVPEKWRDSNPAERPARSRKTSLAVAAQLPAGLKLCSSCRKVRTGLHLLTDTRDYFQGRHCRDYLLAYKTCAITLWACGRMHCGRCPPASAVRLQKDCVACALLLT